MTPEDAVDAIAAHLAGKERAREWLLAQARESDDPVARALGVLWSVVFAPFLHAISSASPRWSKAVVVLAWDFARPFFKARVGAHAARREVGERSAGLPYDPRVFGCPFCADACDGACPEFEAARRRQIACEALQLARAVAPERACPPDGVSLDAATRALYDAVLDRTLRRAEAKLAKAVSDRNDFAVHVAGLIAATPAFACGKAYCC